MATALDAPSDRLDDQEKAFVAQIREHGWFRTNVFADDERPGFSYTTGFHQRLKAPEIIVFALKSEIAHDVLWDIYRDTANGVVFPTGRRLSNVFGNIEAVFLPVSKAFYADHLGWSRWFTAVTIGLACSWSGPTPMVGSRGKRVTKRVSPTASLT